MTPREKDMATYELLGKFVGVTAIIKYRHEMGLIDLKTLDELFALLRESIDLDAKRVIA